MESTRASEAQLRVLFPNRPTYQAVPGQRRGKPCYEVIRTSATGAERRIGQYEDRASADAVAEALEAASYREL